MPEGPSIVILTELTAEFIGREIISVSGNSKIDQSRLVGQRIQDIRSFGKQLLIAFAGFSLRIHLLLFGTYRINERKDSPARLSLQCSDNSELNFYACSVRYIKGKLDDNYEWRSDVMSPDWDSELADEKLLAQPDILACDALLDQNIFTGAGNIIKNEVLFRIEVHPLSTTGGLPATKRQQLITEARNYSFQFLAWKKAFELKKHWLVHTKNTCPRCQIPLQKGKLGKTRRRSFYCQQCQIKYT